MPTTISRLVAPVSPVMIAAWCPFLAAAMQTGAIGVLFAAALEPDQYWALIPLGLGVVANARTLAALVFDRYTSGEAMYFFVASEFALVLSIFAFVAALILALTVPTLPWHSGITPAGLALALTGEAAWCAFLACFYGGPYDDGDTALEPLEPDEKTPLLAEV